MLARVRAARVVHGPHDRRCHLHAPPARSARRRHVALRLGARNRRWCPSSPSPHVDDRPGPV
jgi:hypothetical protein